MTSIPTGTVTFLVTDIEGSSRLWAAHPDGMKEALTRHDALLADALASHGGYVFKNVGDGFFAAFSRPADAVAAAVAVQRRLSTESWPDVVLGVRIACHTGAADEREGDYFGNAMNRSSRLVAIGHGGQVLLSLVTTELVRDELPKDVTYRDLGEHRLRDLGRPEPVSQVVAPGLETDFPPLASLESFPNNLPVALTSFVGREAEIAQVMELMRSARLVTLSGVGGAGKTRLALQVAADLVSEYRDGVWLVEVAEIEDPLLVDRAAASALGLREEPDRPVLETLKEAVHTKQLLLILDNCEHLLDACAELVYALLRASPQISILVTSRESLAVDGETVWQVPALSFPEPSDLADVPDTVSSLGQYEAVRLFVDRALAARPKFRVTNQNAPAVADVCHRLDGIPLAIELAAARVKHMPVEQVADRLVDRFHLLTGGSRTALPRHKTLRATIDWSFDLLGQSEQMLFVRLAVFRGGWTLEAAEAVCALESGEVECADVLDSLSHLVDKSLVVAEERDGTARYRFLRSVFQYAEGKARASAIADTIRGRHAAYYLAMVQESVPHLTSADQAVWLDRLEVEHANLRGGLGWCTQAGSSEATDVARQFAAALWRFWMIHCHLREGRAWLEKVAALPGDADPALEALVLYGAGSFASQQGDLTAATATLSRALAMFREAGQREGESWALNDLAGVAAHEGDYDRARGLYEESLVLKRAVAPMWDVARTLSNLGELAWRAGNLDRAASLYRESLQLHGEQGEDADMETMAGVLHNLAEVARCRGRLGQSGKLYRRALDMSVELGDTVSIARCLTGLGGVAGGLGHPRRAGRLLAAAEVLRERVGYELDSRNQAEHDRLVHEARQQVDADTWLQVWSEGERMSLAEATALTRRAL